MGGNGELRTDSISYFRNGSYWNNNYLGNLADFYTRSLNYCPGNIWSAKIATQMLNMSTHNLAFPYGQYYNFTGTPRYVVASFSELPYNVALALQGYSQIPTVGDLKASADNFTINHLLGTKTQSIAKNIDEIKSIGAWKDHEALADHPDLQEEAKEIEKKAKVLEKKLELILKNEAGLAPSELLESVRELSEEVAELEGDTKDLAARCREVEAEYAAKKQEESQEKVDEEAEGAGDPSGDTSVETKEGDKKMDTDGLAAEYNVKKPIITEDQDVSAAAHNVKTALDTMNDTKAYNAIIDVLDTTKAVNANNIVEVLQELGSYDLYGQIQTLNKEQDKEILLKFFALLTERINLLKDNGYLTAEEASIMKNGIKDMKAKFTDTDLPGTSPKIQYNGKELDVNGLFKEISGQLKGKGTQSDFDAKIEAKQDERIKKATADFYKDHANANPGKEVNGTPALPAGVTYLPNSKMFQWEYDSSTVFKAKSYKELREKIWATKKEAIMTKWMEVTKELDKGLKDKAAS